MLTEEEVKVLQDELESKKEELEKLRQEKETASGLLSLRDSRIAELEQAVAARDSDITILKKTVAELEEKLGSLNQSLTQAVSSYRALVVKSNPEVPEELVSGDTIGAIDGALESSRVLINRVREGLKTEMAAIRVPAGAPQRTSIDLSALSPREKIQYGMGGRR